MHRVTQVWASVLQEGLIIPILEKILPSSLLRLYLEGPQHKMDDSSKHTHVHKIKLISHDSIGKIHKNNRYQSSLAISFWSASPRWELHPTTFITLVVVVSSPAGAPWRTLLDEFPAWGTWDALTRPVVSRGVPC